MHMATPHTKKHYLREWREFRGMTLEQVGPMIPMTHQNLGKIERGATNYTQPVLEALAQIYGTTVADLLVRNPVEPESIYTIWEQLEPAAQSQVVEIAKTFCKVG